MNNETMKDYINVQPRRKSDHTSIKDCLKVLAGSMVGGVLVVLPVLMLGY